MLFFSKKFPPSLCSRASAMYAKAVANSFTAKALLIERLASDPRMDTVWTELTKRVRLNYQPTAKYFYPAHPPEHAAASLAMDPQLIALEELFCWIVSTVECSQLLAPADDVPVADLLLKVKAQGYSVEAGNVRHEHEWKVFRDVKVPDGKVLIPGVVSHATNVLEHPEVVADRLINYASVVGRENVIASTDCGLGGRIHPQLAWAKLKALREGADLASKQLWK